ncbi:MAG: DNA primase small subunit domain-containing protein [Candidatus Woesearchaeota archaeon]
MHPILLKSIAVKHYFRSIISDAIAEECMNREVAVKYSYGFGKRPEMIETGAEIRQLALQGSTSYHISEELWENPLDIKTGMTEKEYNNIRIGWDLIIDIDAPDWRFCKVVCATMIRVLKDLGIKTIRVKFSGNKGFHIGVPWESFPKEASYNNNTAELSSLFPQLPREIARIMIAEADKNHIRIDDQGKIIFLEEHYFEREEIKEILGIEDNELLVKKCESCNNIYEEDKTRVYECPNCMARRVSEEEYLKCTNCNIDMNIITKVPRCECGNTTFYTALNVERILHLDTLLISPRHLYRSPYSIHEKSGLCSIPIDKDTVLGFEKHYARPEYIAKIIPFINSEIREGANSKEGVRLIRMALDNIQEPLKETSYEEIDVPKEALGEEHYPPCIKNALQGIKDGKKRTVLIMSSYLRSIGWDKSSAEKIIYSWNNKNEEPLREVYIKGQLRHAFQGKPMLPPNCDHKDYMKDIGLCTPDEFCMTIRNPAQYSKKKHEMKKTIRKGRKKKDANKEKKKEKKEEKTHNKEENNNENNT